MTIRDKKASARGEAWLEGLFHQHGHAIRRYAHRRSPHATDDIVADVFAIAWRRRDDVPDNELPWLYGVAKNVVLAQQRNAIRRERLVAKVAGTTTPITGGIAQVTDQLAAVKVVHAIFDQLDDRDAEVLRLWAWENLTSQDLAKTLGISPAGARTRLARARKRAAKALGVTDSPSKKAKEKWGLL